MAQHHTSGFVAKRLGVNYHTLRGWVQKANAASATCTVLADLLASPLGVTFRSEYSPSRYRPMDYRKHLDVYK